MRSPSDHSYVTHIQKQFQLFFIALWYKTSNFVDTYYAVSCHTLCYLHISNVECLDKGAVHMSRASPANRADLSHENL